MTPLAYALLVFVVMTLGSATIVFLLHVAGLLSDDADNLNFFDPNQRD